MDSPRTWGPSVRPPGIVLSGRAGRLTDAAYLLPLLIAASLLSCSTGPSDISEILVSGPTVVDVTSDSATITAVTDVDMACAVAYGPTTKYGGLATDLDMAGGGHRDHKPRLLGLQPDTEYHFRFGGIGPDGTVYASEDFTFRTLPASASVSRRGAGANLALLSKGARVAARSSNFGGGADDGAWGANHAVDGDPRTQWSTDGDGDDAWIEIELPSEAHVTSIGFWTRTMGTSGQIFSFRVVTESGAIGGPFRLDDADGIFYFDTDLTAKRLRFEAVETSGGNTGVHDIEVYGGTSH